MLRAGMVAVVAAGTLVGVAAPAFADVTSVTTDPVGDFHPGDKQQLKVQAQGTGTGQKVEVTGLTGDFDISLTSVSSGGCTKQTSTSCTFDFGISGKKDLTFTITAHPTVSVGAGQSATIHLSVNGGGQGATVDFKLFGPPASQAPSAVNQITGTVKDIGSGKPIAQATVGLQDSAGHNFSTTTDSLGRFTFRSTQANPIAPGTLAIEAVKDGYKPVSKTATVQAGASFNFQALTLESSATPAASAPAAADPSQPPADSPAPQAATTTAAKTGGSSGFSTILIALGALLVLLGIGAIVFILVRRRRDDGEDPDELDEQAPRRGPTPVPASRGAYRDAPDRTAVVRSGGYGDPTTAGRSPMSDAPTMMHARPPADEYPDPYGAPPQPGYGSGGYGDQDRGYGGGNTYGGQSQHGGNTYGQPEPPPARGYDDRADYDPPPPRGAYGGTTYGQPEPPPRGYDERPDYDPPSPRGDGYQSGGYDRGGGYGGRETPPPPAGYETPAGYEPPGGYEQRGGHEPRGGYPARGGYDEPRGGHEEPRGGYDGGQSRRGNPPPDSRRQLDWLDD
jgi:hypothetical protein